MFEFKHPSQAFYIEADFTQLVEAGGTITPTWTIPAGLSLTAQFVTSDGLARGRLEGGTNGTLYACSCTATNSAGTDTREFKVFVTSDVDIEVVSVEEFAPLVVIAVPGCPTTAIWQAISQAAHRFCKDSGCWKYRLPGLPVNAGGSAIELPTPDEAQIVGVSNVSFSTHGKPTPVTPNDVENADMRMAPGSPAIYSHDRIALMWHPALRADDTLACTVFMAPDSNATMLPAFLARQHLAAIAHGAKAELLSIPGATWTNMEAAGISETRFRAAKDDAKLETIIGVAPAQMRARPGRRLGC